MKPMREVAADFDAIAAALAESPRRDRLTPAERFLLGKVPTNAVTAIDVGCGDGTISRAMGQRGLRVVAVDVSPRMIHLARSRTACDLPVDYRLMDIMSSDVPEEFDVVVSVAMAHHVPLDAIIPRLARLVAPGGVLLVQDVVERRGFTHIPTNIAAMSARVARQLLVASRISSRVASAYREHGGSEAYLDASAVATTFESLLPGAVVTLHLEWRYSVVWQARTHAT